MYCVACIVLWFFIFVFIERTGKDYKESVHFWQAYVTEILLHSLFLELLSIYSENTVLGYYKRPWPFPPLLMWHRISASYWQFTCHCFEPVMGEYWRLRQSEWRAYIRVYVCWAPLSGSICRLIIAVNTYHWRAIRVGNMMGFHSTLRKDYGWICVEFGGTASKWKQKASKKNFLRWE